MTEKTEPIRSECLFQSYKNVLKRTNASKSLIYFGQMTEIFQRENTGEKDKVIDSISSVTMSDRHVLSQYYGLVIMFGWRWRNVCIR